MKNLSTGAAIASAAAALFALGVTTSAHANDYAQTPAFVKCSGINSCKGTSECKTAKNECKGHNSCKGQGWVKKADEAECKAAGGSVLK